MKPSATRRAGSGGKNDSTDYSPVPGSEIDPMPGAKDVGAPKDSQRIEVTILLRSHAPQGLLASVNEMAYQAPAERKYLTRQAYKTTHGAHSSDIQEIARFAKQYGLRVSGKHAAARTVQLSGTIANVSRAFRVTLRNYRFPDGTYRGRTGPVYVPAALAGIVEGVFGLDNRPIARPHVRIKHQRNSALLSKKDISYSPPQVAQLYKFPAGATGAGQCIGIIEIGGGYTARNLNTYFKSLGIKPPKIIAVPVAGGRNKPNGNPNGDDSEVQLDIEMAGAIAPGAKIAVYFAPNHDQGFLRAIKHAIHDDVHKPSVISISWGGPEGTYTKQSLKAFDEAFQAAGLLGITVCVSAGDSGSADGVPGKKAHLDFPGSSPHGLSCGGTTIKVSGDSITSEVVWNNGPGNGATGGGISDYFPLPDWQTKAGVPRSVNGGRIGRGVPDIAANGNQWTGYRVRIDGHDQILGGTSAVAPLMAALIAMLNEKLGIKAGFVNPYLYGMLGNTAAFHDITEGNNDLTGKVGGYSARIGWDPCSGFGSPDGTAILEALQKTSKDWPSAGQAAPKKKKKAAAKKAKSR
ncbi:MAG TPA: S53 family peptidase [Bryobacteraceae bacterium]|nr:S53 family peptidase [Bryobacteraceae bacterium]